MSWKCGDQIIKISILCSERSVDPSTYILQAMGGTDIIPI